MNTFCSLLLIITIGTNAINALQQPRQQAIVVGSGPVGVATSLILATNHNYDVTLLESSPASSTQTKYDPTKAFLYNVNGRGQRLTKMFPSMHQRMVERSVISKGFGGTKLTIVPADPEEAIPEQKANVPAAADKEDDGNDNKSMPSGEKAGNVGFWIPRHEMVKLMVEEIEEHNKRGLGGRITLCTGQECVSVVPSTTKDGESGTVVVTTKDASSSSSTKEISTNEYNANLVIGADGMNSKVRQCLHNAPPGTWSSNCLKSSKFQPKTYTSPASFLRIKVLQLPPQFEIPDANGKPPLKTFSEDIYAIRSVNTGPRTFLSLGLLPMKDNTAVRPTNIITRPDHGIWKITNGKSMREYFQQAFPRFNFQEGGLISNEEWDRFAKAEGTRFPPCQYSPGLAVWDTSGSSGVALVGDSIHAFSPDIGQGVNAGLMDVVCLDRALSGLDDVESGGKEVDSDTATEKTKKQTTTLEANLQRYQKQHAPEIAALIRLARFGAPYQYKQPHRADRALRLVWTANVAMRLLLNKVSFGVIQPPCIILSQNEDLTFRQVMRRADRTTALLKTIVLAGLTLWAKRRFGLALFRALP